MNWSDLLGALRASRRTDAAAKQASQDAADDRLLTYVQAQDDYRRYATVGERIRSEFDLFTLHGSSAVGVGALSERLATLARRPELAPALIFHGDGRIREAALKMLDGPLDHPVVVYGLVTRLNDWSPEVRDVAVKAFERCFLLTPTEILLPAVWSLLLNTRDWRRWWYKDDWKPREAIEFEPAVLGSKKLVEALASWVAADNRRGAGYIFRFLCRSPHLDTMLPALAATARVPHIRTIAVSCLAAGRTRWPLGTRRQIRGGSWREYIRMVPDFGERPINVDYDLVEILAKALDDRAAMVRREAFDAVIAHRRDPRFRPLIDRCLHDLHQDSAPGIRLRADYLKRKIAEESPTG